MIPPPSHPDEARRLAALDALRVLYTPAEERFDRITRLAARILDVPIVLVSLIGRDVQWFKSRFGLDASETSRAVSFCGHAILGSESMVVADARLDVRFADNPLVTGGPGIRFYAGCPLRSEEGLALGTLCVIDSKPRALSGDDLTALEDLGAIAEHELLIERLLESRQQLTHELADLSRKALVDSLTGLWNRGAIGEVLSREWDRTKREQTSLSVIMVDVDRFKSINDTFGHQTGDTVLREIASRLRGAVRQFDVVGRWGGEEFLVVSPGCGAEAAQQVGERLRARVARGVIRAAGAEIPVTVSCGVATTTAPSLATPEVLVAAADAALYRAKRSGRNCVERTIATG